MKRNSTHSSDRKAHSIQHTAYSIQQVLLSVCCLLSAALVGCESLQRKFTRKSKPGPPPTPIISFQDYSQAMTPLDRYRKHYLMFDYWNSDLLASLQRPPLNPKRYRLASSESLNELQELKKLLTDDIAARLSPLIEERTVLHQEIQGSSWNSPAQAMVPLRKLESQSRAFHRDFSWRDVEDHIKQ